MKNLARLFSRDRIYFIFLLGIFFCFVPVYLAPDLKYFPLGATTVPLSAVAFDKVVQMLEGKPSLITSFTMPHSLEWLAAFAILGALLTRLTRRLQCPHALVAARILIATGLFATSFLRVLTYYELGWGPGTYCFWTAVPRYFEHYQEAHAVRPTVEGWLP